MIVQYSDLFQTLSDEVSNAQAPVEPKDIITEIAMYLYILAEFNQVPWADLTNTAQIMAQAKLEAEFRHMEDQ